MRMRRHRRAEEDVASHGIDLAPMLDFTTNLLIFFIITAVFAKQFGLVVNRPSSTPQQSTKKLKLIPIRVLATGKVSMDGRTVSLGAVRANIARELALNPNANVLIIAQKGAPNGVLVQVVDKAHLAGVSNVTFSIQQ